MMQVVEIKNLNKEIKGTSVLRRKPDAAVRAGIWTDRRQRLRKNHAHAGNLRIDSSYLGRDPV